jgi:mannose-6-phosphate isomerase-like protein (cupin superfamily)
MSLAGKYFRASFLTLVLTGSVADDVPMTQEIDDVQIVNVDEVEPVEVVPGIVRRRLAATQWARGWMYDFAPGAEWPEVDVHESEERYYVVSGEFIDRGRRLGPGSYVVFAPGSTHRPRTETGARMIGISIISR